MGNAMAKRKPQYGKVLDSRVFEKRSEAEEWAKKKNSELKQQGYSGKTGVSFEMLTSGWKATLMMKVGG